MDSREEDGVSPHEKHAGKHKRSVASRLSGWLDRFWPRFAWNTTLTVLTVVIISAVFLRALMTFSTHDALILDLSAASFVVGCLVGFLFTSYGEENATVGKVRDWVVGGLAGLTIAKFDLLRTLILAFASGEGPQPYALVVGIAVTFSALGFFVMFFQRELILNVLLARSRAERGNLEGSRQAGSVALRLLAALPPSLLSGIDDVDGLVQDRKPEAEKLRALLYSADVEKFLTDAGKAVTAGAPLEWDVVSKAATLNYYRTYYERGDKKVQQEEGAAEWLKRALLMNPLHVDLQAKYADVLGMLERYDETVAILEGLERSPESPAYIKQWLGYFLLFIPGREDDAICVSTVYHSQFPSETDAIYNIACGHAQKYCKELKVAKKRHLPESNERSLALTFLVDSIDRDPRLAKHSRTMMIKGGESFECLADDEEFKKIVGIKDSK